MARLDFKVHNDGTVYMSRHINLAQDRHDEEVGGGDPNGVRHHVTVEVDDETTAANIVWFLENAHDIQTKCGYGGGGETKSGVEQFLTALMKAVRELPAE